MSRKVRIKPGKGQSAAGMAVGIVFCLIGVFLAIPAMGIFGVIWTVFALVITVMNGINAFSDEGIPTHEIVIDDRRDLEDSPSSLVQTQQKSVQERLKLVERLYEEGSITREEYEQKRRKILEEI